MSDILKNVADILGAEQLSDEDPDEDGVLMGQDFVTFRQLENDCAVLGSHYGCCHAKFLIEQAGRVCTWQPDEDFGEHTGQPQPTTMQDLEKMAYEQGASFTGLDRPYRMGNGKMFNSIRQGEMLTKVFARNYAATFMQVMSANWPEEAERLRQAVVNK